MTGSKEDMTGAQVDEGNSFSCATHVVFSDPALPPTDQAWVWADPILGGVEATSCRFLHHRLAPHTHETLMLGLIRSGAKTFARNGRTHSVGPSDVLVVNPGEAHTGARAGEDELQYRALYVHSSLLGIEANLEVRPATLTDSVIFDLLWAASHAIITRAPVLERQERLLAGVGLIGLRYSALRRSTDASAPWRVQRAREILADNWAHDIPIETVSRQVGLSPYHLMRSFRRHFALPMHAYQLGLRLDCARRMLRDGKDSLVEVALACGFADQSHFTRRFKAHFGFTPGAYRQAFAM